MSKSASAVRSALVVWCLIGVAVWAANAGASRAELPERLTHHEFWQLSAMLSEEGAPFISDNLVSNEQSFAQVVPEILAWGVRDGVYLGVGPEQNFTYIATMRARMGFILDIRRENLLLHLLYKALFDLSPNRVSFVSSLFVRPAMRDVGEGGTARELMTAVVEAREGTAEDFARQVEHVRRTLVDKFQFPLTADDLATIRSIHGAFHTYGPQISYATTLLKKPYGVSYAELMQQEDASGRELSYLATEGAYQFVRGLQSRNLVIPVVGNFAGEKALRAAGGYLERHNATVSAFYVSNVEDHLGRVKSIPRNGDWAVFCANVAALPANQASVLIRPLGLAAFDSGGVFRMSQDMHIESRDAEVYQPGVVPALPKALVPMIQEVQQCR